MEQKSLAWLVHRLNVKWIRKMLDVDNKVYYYNIIWWGDLDAEGKEILQELINRSVLKWEDVKLVKVDWKAAEEIFK